MEITVMVFPVRGEHICLARKKTGAAKGCLSGWRDHFIPDDLFIEFTCCRVMKEQGNLTIHPDDLMPVSVVNFFYDGEHRSRCHIYFIEEKVWCDQLRETTFMGEPEEYPFSEVPYEEMLSVDRVWLTRILNQKERFIGAVHLDAKTNGEPTFEFLELFPRGLL